MGYMHINNAYKFPLIFEEKEVYALEKIHGTSAHVRYKDGVLSFFSGGVKQTNFVKLFDEPALMAKFKDFGHQDVTVYGEAYGGGCQRMSDVYGPNLKFVAFDVKVADTWLTVPDAQKVANSLGIEFVYWQQLPCTKEALDAARDMPSVQAVRNGFPFPGSTKALSEGIVIRPLVEKSKGNERIIAKHKNEVFGETAKPREISPEKLQVLNDARAIAEEWVTEMRLDHVLQKLPGADITKTGDVVRAMMEDVKRESEGEVIWSKEAERAVGQKASMMFKKRVTSIA